MNEAYTKYKEKQEKCMKIAKEVVELLKTKEVPICEAEEILDLASNILQKTTIVK